MRYLRPLVALAAVASSATLAASVKVGDKLPSIDLHQGFPPNKINLASYATNKSIILVGLPGAFTPTWSSRQVPSYQELQNTLKEKAGVDEIIIYCVNDGAVMNAWAEDQMINPNGMIQFMGDPEGALTRTLEMELNHPGPHSVGIIGRCKRFAVYAVNGEVKYVAVSEREDDPAGDDYPEDTLAEALLDAILKHKNDEL